MNKYRVGALLVMSEDKLLGIFTERDVLTRVVASGRKAHELKVAEVMTQEVLCCKLNTELDEVAEIMQLRRIRHLPVRDNAERVVGLISIGDVNAYHVMQKQRTIENMTDYICGRG